MLKPTIVNSCSAVKCMCVFAVKMVKLLLLVLLLVTAIQTVHAGGSGSEKKSPAELGWSDIWPGGSDPARATKENAVTGSGLEVIRVLHPHCPLLQDCSSVPLKKRKLRSTGDVAVLKYNVESNREDMPATTTGNESHLQRPTGKTDVYKILVKWQEKGGDKFADLTIEEKIFGEEAEAIARDAASRVRCRILPTDNKDLKEDFHRLNRKSGDSEDNPSVTFSKDLFTPENQVILAKRCRKANEDNIDKQLQWSNIWPDPELVKKGSVEHYGNSLKVIELHKMTTAPTAPPVYIAVLKYEFALPCVDDGGEAQGQSCDVQQSKAEKQKIKKAHKFRALLGATTEYKVIISTGQSELGTLIFKESMYGAKAKDIALQVAAKVQQQEALPTVTPSPATQILDYEEYLSVPKDNQVLPAVIFRKEWFSPENQALLAKECREKYKAHLYHIRTQLQWNRLWPSVEPENVVMGPVLGASSISLNVVHLFQFDEKAEADDAPPAKQPKLSGGEGTNTAYGAVLRYFLDNNTEYKVILNRYFWEARKGGQNPEFVFQEKVYFGDAEALAMEAANALAEAKLPKRFAEEAAKALKDAKLAGKSATTYKHIYARIDAHVTYEMRHSALGLGNDRGEVHARAGKYGVVGSYFAQIYFGKKSLHLARRCREAFEKRERDFKERVGKIKLNFDEVEALKERIKKRAEQKSSHQKSRRQKRKMDASLRQLQRS